MSLFSISSRIHTSTPFISTWKTDNTGSTVTTSTRIKIPTISTGKYNCRVYWGDGNFNDITTYNDIAWTHTYSSAGTYTITIHGVFEGFCFNGAGDASKIVNISQWGTKFRLGDSEGFFYTCDNLTITATDILNTSGSIYWGAAFSYCPLITSIPNIGKWNMSEVESLAFCFEGSPSISNINEIASWNVGKCSDFSYMFLGLTGFNADISGWDVKNAVYLDGMLQDCTSFNRSLGSWPLPALTSAYNMLRGVTLSKANYNATLAGWGVASTNSGVTFSGGNSHYDSSTGGYNGTAGRTYLTGTKGWTITDGGTP